MSSCVINGKPCTMCCRAIILERDQIEQLDAKVKNQEVFDCPDYSFIKQYWKEITIEEALRVNPYLSNTWKSLNKEQHMCFTCSCVTETGCGNYPNRPKVCREYPLYQRSYWEFLFHQMKQNPDYHKDCTAFTLIPIINI